MVRLPTPALAAMASTLTADQPPATSRSQVAPRIVWCAWGLRREASGTAVHLRDSGDQLFVRLVPGILQPEAPLGILHVAAPVPAENPVLGGKSADQQLVAVGPGRLVGLAAGPMWTHHR